MLRVTVWQGDSLSGDFEVKSNGALRHPLYNEVIVAGLPPGELEKTITTFLQRFERNPQIELVPLQKVAVAGAVRTPGTYVMAPESTIADAITKGGGITDRGRLDSVTLIRDGRRSVLDVTDPTPESGGLSIRSGDQIIVGEQRAPLRDYIGPAASVVSSLLSLIHLLRR